MGRQQQQASRAGAGVLKKDTTVANGRSAAESFTVLQSMGLDTPGRQLCFRFEGVCSGMLATDVDLLLKDMESTL